MINNSGIIIIIDVHHVIFVFKIFAVSRSKTYRIHPFCILCLFNVILIYVFMFNLLMSLIYTSALPSDGVYMAGTIEMYNISVSSI